MKKRKIIALFLTIAMAITMMPLSVFADEPQQTGGEAGPQILVDNPEAGDAITNSDTPEDAISDGEESEPICGTKENPIEMSYWRNQYSGDAWTYDSYDSREMWFKMETRSETELAFKATTYSDEDLIRSVTMYDSDMTTVLYKFDYNDEYDCYDTDKIKLKKQTYYFKMKFSQIPIDKYYSIFSKYDDTIEASGTFADPVIIKSDQNTKDDEFEDYYVDAFYLKEDTQSVYYKLDAFKTDYYGMYLYALNEVGIKSIKLIDSNRNVLAEFEKYVYDEDALPEDYANYILDNYHLEKGKRYYIEVLIDKSVEDDYLDLSFTRLDGNGLRENPFKLSYLPSEYSEWYYGYGQYYKNNDTKEVWVKATVEKDAKIKAYAGTDNELEESIIDKVELYLPGADTAVNLEKNKDGVYCQSDYVPVKKGDVILFKYTFNDNVKAGDPVYSQLDCFGLTDMDVTLELDRLEYTYDGKEHKPGLAYIKYKDNDLVAGTDYDPELIYNDTINIGLKEVEVKGKGDYQGSRFLHFAINPKGTKLTSLTGGTKRIYVKWKKQDKKMSVDRITGYQIQYSTSKKFTKATTKTVAVKGYKKTSKTIKRLKTGKKYYVRIRTYYTDGYYCENVYSTWSASNSVRVK